MFQAIVMTPFQTTVSAYSKVTAYLRPVLMVFAASAFRVIPDTGSVQLTINGGRIAADEFDQFLFQCRRHFDPRLFTANLLSRWGFTGRPTGDIAWVAHVQAADPT